MLLGVQFAEARSLNLGTYYVGSHDVYLHPPPLGIRLYSQLKIQYPQTWGKLPQNFDELLNKNFEEGMMSIFNSGQTSLIIPGVAIL